jgi:hypothetical protein
MINWAEFARLNNLTPDEFQKEILTVAACVGAMIIDEKNTGHEILKFTCSDEKGKIIVLIQRLEEPVTSQSRNH